MRSPAAIRRCLRALERDERIDAVAERLRPLATSLDRGPLGPVLRGEWVGHALHPLMTDLPLGCFLGSGLLDLAGGPGARRCSRLLVGVGLVSAVPTAATGLADWSRSTDERVYRVGAVHAVGNSAMLGVYGASWLARGRGHTALGLTLGLLGGTMGWATGYLGGHMAFNLGSGVGDRGLRDWGGRPRGTAPA